MFVMDKELTISRKEEKKSTMFTVPLQKLTEIVASILELNPEFDKRFNDLLKYKLITQGNQDSESEPDKGKLFRSFGVNTLLLPSGDLILQIRFKDGSYKNIFSVFRGTHICLTNLLKDSKYILNESDIILIETETSLILNEWISIGNGNNFQ